MKFSLLVELISENGNMTTMESAMNSGDGSAYCSRPTDLFDVNIVHIPYRSFVQENLIILLFEHR